MDNPSAFPIEYPTVASYVGMTLLDAFALSIAGGMAAYSGTSGASFGPSDIAARSYEVASAMLSERNYIAKATA